IELDAGVAPAVGYVYPTDPRAALEQRPLFRLIPNSGLRSRRVTIEDVNGPQAFGTGGGDFLYGAGRSELDQVNAYWHADRFLNEFLPELGYTGPADSVIVRVHAEENPGVAHTVGNIVYLGLGIATLARDAALADDIIYHELTHTVIYG